MEFVQAAIIGISLGAQYALLALGFTLIFGILGVVNFSHGGFYMLGGYVAYSCVAYAGLPYPLAVLVAVLVTAALGWVFELFLLERLVDDHLATLMLTLGLYLVISTGMLTLFGPLSMDFPFPVSGALHLGAIYVPRQNLIVLAICLAAIAALWLVLYRTDLGRGLRALADDRGVAMAQGLRPKLLFPLAFAIATGLAGLTGALVTPILSLSPGVGDPVLATSFLTVILGGLGSLEGAALAALRRRPCRGFLQRLLRRLHRRPGAVRAGAAAAGVPPHRLDGPHGPGRLSVRRSASALPWTELVALLLLALGFAVPWFTHSVLIYSVLNQVFIGVIAAESVWIMLRMNLLSFATPAFMAIGGYTVAIAGQYNITDAALMTAGAFILPALVAIPLGALVLRLRGTYFVLVTFVLSQIMQLLIFETPGLTGGSNGIAGIPPVNLFGIDMETNAQVLEFACGLAILATLITGALTRWFRQHFAAIEENEILAESLGLVIWRYKALGFVIAAGIAGLAGYALVNMLLTAHPSSFDSGTAVDFIAYTIIGGRVSLLGPILGTGALVYATNLFGTHGQYAQGLYGVLILVVVLAARGGIVGTIAVLWRRLSGRRA